MFHPFTSDDRKPCKDMESGWKPHKACAEYRKINAADYQNSGTSVEIMTSDACGLDR